MFLEKGLQSESTLQHEIPLQGNTVVESWIKEDATHDKSVKYGLDAPVGTWLVSMKINDDAIWQLAKSGEIKGFSIEGYFTDKIVMNKKEVTAQEIYESIINM